MKNKIGRLNGVTNLILGIVTLLLGIILLINPDFKMSSLCNVVSTVLLVLGVVLLVLYFGRAEYKNIESSDFAVTMCMILAGVFIMLRKDDISDILPQLLAMYVMLSGVLKMQQAMDLFGMLQKSWPVHFVTGLLITALSALVVIFPEADLFTQRDGIPLYLCVLLTADGALGIICLLHATAKKNDYHKKHPQEPAGAIEEKNDAKPDKKNKDDEN